MRLLSMEHFLRGWYVKCAVNGDEGHDWSLKSCLRLLGNHCASQISGQWASWLPEGMVSWLGATWEVLSRREVRLLFQGWFLGKKVRSWFSYKKWTCAKDSILFIWENQADVITGSEEKSKQHKSWIKEWNCFFHEVGRRRRKVYWNYLARLSKLYLATIYKEL